MTEADCKISGCLKIDIYLYLCLTFCKLLEVFRNNTHQFQGANQFFNLIIHSYQITKYTEKWKWVLN